MTIFIFIIAAFHALPILWVAFTKETKGATWLAALAMPVVAFALGGSDLFLGGYDRGDSWLGNRPIVGLRGRTSGLSATTETSAGP